MFTALISSLALGQSLLVAHLLSRRVVHSNVYLPLAIFFAANAIAQLCFILREPSVFGADIIFIPGLTLFKLIVELTLPPLLWIYVRELTSTHSLGWRKSDIWHFVFPLVPSVILAIISYLFTTNTEIGGNPETSLIGELNGVLNIAALVQFCVYVIFVMRRLPSRRRAAWTTISTEPTIISRMVFAGRLKPPMVIIDSRRDKPSRGELA